MAFAAPATSASKSTRLIKGRRNRHTKGACNCVRKLRMPSVGALRLDCYRRRYSSEVRSRPNYAELFEAVS